MLFARTWNDNALPYRILIFYILGVLVTGMLVPYNDERLLQVRGWPTIVSETAH